MKLWKKALAGLTACFLLLTAAACGGNVIGNTSSSNDVTILTTAAVGTDTTADDPYRKYIADRYGLNATLIAATDFTTTALLKFSDLATSPDIVAFSDVDSFRTIFNQGVLLSDWTPYLDSMPNFKSIVQGEDKDRPGETSIARLMLTEEERLTALWTLPDPPTWSLKVREDWADEYRATTSGGVTPDGKTYPAGAVATNGGAWQPASPDDLLHFARWIRAVKNTDQSNLTCFGFSTAGEKTDFGVLGTWVPLMYGSVCQLPWGMYFDEAGNVNYGIEDGTHKSMLDFINTLISEKLIESNWYYQSASDKMSKAGNIGIEWYTGSLSEETQAYMKENNKTDEDGQIIDTTDWWKTYPVPKHAEAPLGGYQASDGFLGTILTVSAKAANDSEKMKKICAFLDDLAMTKTEHENGSAVYNRSEAYNALRWGVGIESSLSFQEIEGTNQVYLYTGEEDAASRSYRSRYPGAWDWGMFFRSQDDGVVQGVTSPTVNAITRKVVEHNSVTAGYSRRLQYGSVLKLDTQTVSTLTRLMQQFEYGYVNTKWKSDAESRGSFDTFRQKWRSLGGSVLMEDALKQFKRLGFIG